MKKVIAVLRSLILLVILYLAVVKTPFEVFGSGDSMIKVEGVRKLVQATWLAIGWIAIETAIAWFQALRKPKPAGAPKAGKEPPSPGPEPAAVKPEVGAKQE
ncbi:MAG: hypothetical protein HY906_09200 [Deltaproteobacteria bacterium]|nr:hypothetical protein [Deltaproteobacteria bacterium]